MRQVEPSEARPQPGADGQTGRPEQRQHAQCQPVCGLRWQQVQQAYGEAMLELRARKKLASLLGNEDEK
mgnify:CR=1 FL=1